MTTDLRLNEPRYASLPNIMKAKKKPIAEKTPADYGVDVAPRLKVLKITEPASRKAGRQGRVGGRTGRQTQERSRGDLMTTLLLAEVHDGQLNDATAKALTAAVALGAPVHVLVAGAGGDAAQAAVETRGRRKSADRLGRRLRPWLAEPMADLIVALAPAYDAIVAPATSNGKNVLPRVAALLDVAQVSEISKVVSPDTFERPIYAGNAIQTVQATDAKKVITVRTSTFAAAGRRRLGGDRSRVGAADAGLSSFQERGAGQIRPSGTDLRENHHFRRPGDAERGKFQDLHRAGGRQARRGHGRVARRRGRGLCAQ